MYKLTYFKATNITGFVSGLQRKTFELDLHDLSDKDIIVILGDNATGKSTFLSFIHPLHTPTNKKKKFVVEGKEGTIIREYTADDGTIISTRCIYSPSGTKHNSKLFFKIMYPDGDEKEMNPSGNVSSYYDLVKEYFGINQDFINFASYNNTVKGIVSMTDSERKSNTAPLMPNTNRFEMAHNIINEKYKEYRSIMRNISQKIVKLRDEPLLKGELKRLERQINSYNDDRESLIKKSARCDGRIKELSDGKDVEELISEYRLLDNELRTLRNDLTVLSYVREYNFENSKKTSKHISDSLEELSKKQLLYADRLSNTRKQLYSDEHKFEELEVLIDNISANDLDDMYFLRESYRDKVKTLRYRPSKDSKYNMMSYEEAITLIKNVGKLSEAYDAVYESRGELVSEYYKNLIRNKNYNPLVDIPLQIEQEQKKNRELSDKLNITRLNISKLNSYKNLEEILRRRPGNCTIDTCPFILEALKWNDISKELSELYSREAEELIALDKSTVNISSLSLRYQTVKDLLSIDDFLSSFIDKLNKYLGITIDTIHIDISKGNKKFDSYIKQLEDIAAILSEKDLYTDIMDNKLPDIEKQIKLAESSNAANSYLIESHKTLKKSIEKLTEDNKKYGARLNTINGTIKGLTKEKEFYDKLSSDIDIYIELSDKLKTLDNNNRAYSNKLSTINELYDKQIEYKNDIARLDKLISTVMVSREQYRYELNSLLELKLEKELIENDFNITHIMKSIVQPGKGLWKEILEIYMFDIKNIANQLLLNTFDGNLYLENFIILDDSFIIPYVYKGTLGADISLASDSQQSTISTAMSLAILSKMINKYGILTYDEVDKDLSPSNKEMFINILAKQTKYVGINQNFVITHNPEYYDPYDVGYVLFPGYSLKNKKNKDTIEV